MTREEFVDMVFKYTPATEIKQHQGSNLLFVIFKTDGYECPIKITEHDILTTHTNRDKSMLLGFIYNKLSSDMKSYFASDCKKQSNSEENNNE